ncbi:MAG: hypothetical protein PHP92_05700 [Candidatus Nanoarchaeia archaeon]|nr:hypothetical protein [Candidatus Nanoarchaeia archaeon]
MKKEMTNLNTVSRFIADNLHMNKYHNQQSAALEFKKYSSELCCTKAEIEKQTKIIWNKIQSRIEAKEIPHKYHTSYKLYPKYLFDQKIKHLYISHISDLGHTGRSDSNYSINLYDHDSKKIMAVVNLSGWIKYSRRSNWYVDRTWVVGKDWETGKYFSIRIPNSCKTIAEAWKKIKPAAVIKAEDENRQVIRQGDVYFIQMKSKCILGRLPQNHNVEKTETGYIIHHPEHQTTILTGFNWKCCIQKDTTKKNID